MGLLMLSGVGPPTTLQDFGIKLIAESNGVGRNLQDHLMVPVMASVPTSAGKSNSTYSPYGGYFFSPWCASRTAGCVYPDMELMCGHSVLNWSAQSAAQMCWVGLVGQIQSSTGFLTLKSKNPEEYAA